MKDQHEIQGKIAKLKDVDPNQLPYSSFMRLIHKHLPYMGFPVQEIHITGAFWTLVGLWTALGLIGASFITDTLAIVFPAWMSYKCEKNKTAPTQWLAYWIIYSSFYVVECSQGVTAALPFYHSIKLAILLWCMFPGKGNGATVIYSFGIKPALQMLDGFMTAEAGKKGGASLISHDGDKHGKDDKEYKTELKKSASKESLKNGHGKNGHSK